MGRTLDRAFVLAGVRYAWGLSARGIEVIAKFGLYALAARILGGDASGIFFLCLTLLHLIATVARLGSERPISRNVAAYLASGQVTQARATILQGLILSTVMGLAVGGATFLSAGLQAELFKQPDLAAALRLLALVLPAHVITYGCGNVLIGLDRGAAAQLITNAIAPAVTLLAFVAGVVTLPVTLIVYAASYWGCAIAGLVLIAVEWRRARRRAESAPRRYDELPTLLAGAKEFYVVEIILALLIGAPILVLSRFADAESVSHFSVANRLSMLIATIVLSIATMVAPAYARHHRLQEHGELARVMRQVTLASMAICLPLIAIMMLFRHQLLALMGANGAEAATALLIMAGGQIVVAALPARDTLLAMSGNGSVLRALALAQLVIAAAACAVLIPMFGVIGAAVASTTTWLTGVISCEMLVRAKLPEVRGRLAGRHT